MHDQHFCLVHPAHRRHTHDVIGATSRRQLGQLWLQAAHPHSPTRGTVIGVCASASRATSSIATSSATTCSSRRASDDFDLAHAFLAIEVTDFLVEHGGDIS